MVPKVVLTGGSCAGTCHSDVVVQSPTREDSPRTTAGRKHQGKVSLGLPVIAVAETLSVASPCGAVSLGSVITAVP